MRQFATVIATGLGIFAVGLTMYLANWHPLLGVLLMYAGVAYLLWELLFWRPISDAVPPMLRLVLAVLIAAVIVGASWPGIRTKLYPKPDAHELSPTASPTASFPVFEPFEPLYESRYRELLGIPISNYASGGGYQAVYEHDTVIWVKAGSKRTFFKLEGIAERDRAEMIPEEDPEEGEGLQFRNPDYLRGQFRQCTANGLRLPYSGPAQWMIQRRENWPVECRRWHREWLHVGWISHSAA